MPRDIVDAASVGVHRGRLDVLLERVRQDVEHGPLPSAQIAVAKDGRAVAFATYGDATPATESSLAMGDDVCITAIDR